MHQVASAAAAVIRAAFCCCRDRLRAAFTRNEPSQGGSWLSTRQSHRVTEVDAFLSSLNGRMHLVGCRYSGNQLCATNAFSNGRLEWEGTRWRARKKVEHHGDCIDILLEVTLISGEATEFGIAAMFDFSAWSTDCYILAPALVYGGNRFRIYDATYPPYAQGDRDRPPDMPVTTTNILHLNPDGSHGKIEMNTGNLATPMLSFFNPKAKRGFIVLTGQGTRFGNHGMMIEEDAGPSTAKKRVSFVISAPGVREQRYVMTGRAPAEDRGGDWRVGDSLALKFKIYNFECADIASFYAKVFDVRKALSGPSAYDNITPFSAAAEMILGHHDACRWFETGRTGFYSYHPDDGSPYSNQIGWAGIPIHSFPHLIAETPQRLQRVQRCMDSLLEMQASTGLFYAMRDGRGTVFGDTFSTKCERRSIAMTRRTMDVLYFGLQTIDLMQRRGHAGLVRSEWETSLQAAAEGLLQVWKDYGQFGQFMDVDTGKMDINGSTAGAAAGAGLALASRHYNERKYLLAAEAAMRMYYERDFTNGYAGGGAADILQSPDSETAHDMLESCIALYEITGNIEWIERAKLAANMLATWTVSYDYRFPASSTMARAGTRATGSIFASSQNNHSAPGYFILSGDSLLKLFRATDDRRYAELYKDQSHNVIQYVGAPHNPLRSQTGYVTERVQLSDWEGASTIGDVNFEDSDLSWETLAALTALQNPGIYLRTDDDTLLVMDHVEADVISSTGQSKTIGIRNPTAYDALVSIFAETHAEARTPMGWGAYDKWPHIAVASGGAATVQVDQSGARVLDFGITDSKSLQPLIGN